MLCGEIEQDQYGRNKETTRSPSQAMVVWERLVVEDVVRKGDRYALDRMWVVRGRGCKGGTRIPRWLECLVNNGTIY